MKKQNFIYKKLHTVNDFLRRKFFAVFFIILFLVVFFPGSKPPIIPILRKGFGGGESADIASSSPHLFSGNQVIQKTISMDRSIAHAESGGSNNNENRKIVKSGSLNLEVEDTEISREKIESLISAQQGIITNLSSYRVRQDSLAYNFTIRVPEQHMDKLIENLEKMGEKTSENFSMRDITMFYSDTENQLKNLKTRRESLRKMMSRKTDKLSDVLEIDRELSTVQNQIDSLSRLQIKRDYDTEYSTLMLNLAPTPKIGDLTSPKWSGKKSWKISVNKLINAAQNIADKAIQIVVFSPIWLPLFFFLWLLRKKFWKKKLRL